MIGLARVALICGLTGCAAAAGSGVSYTSPQVREGERAYQVACVGCHAVDLSGTALAPALAGPSFAARWDGRPIAELTRFMQEHMPRENPGLLNDATYAALMAYLLAQNGMPPGEAPLILGALGTIRVGPR